jgi:hypothetical protein
MDMFTPMRRMIITYFNLINTEGDPGFKFKDESYRIKPQAARFRIYGYKNGEVVGEINLKDKHNVNNVKIEWTVVLANKKAAHQSFVGLKNYRQKTSMRNAST